MTFPGQAQVAIPNFIDTRTRLERPDLTGFRSLRFLVDDEYPPLHFAGPEGGPTGFSVELAQAVCEILALTCTIQVRRFDTLLDALGARDGDVVAAAVPITAALRSRFAVTAPYFKIPARFAVRIGRDMPSPSAASLKGRSVAVVQGSAHEAYARAFMEGADIRAFPDLAASENALLASQVDYVFADGLNLSLWIGGTGSADCCAFIGGAYLESRYFGEGIGFVVRKDDEVLLKALDYALQQLVTNGKYAEIYLKFYPISPF